MADSDQFSSLSSSKLDIDAENLGWGLEGFVLDFYF